MRLRVVCAALGVAVALVGCAREGTVWVGLNKPSGGGTDLLAQGDMVSDDGTIADAVSPEVRDLLAETSGETDTAKPNDGAGELLEDAAETPDLSDISAQELTDLDQDWDGAGPMDSLPETADGLDLDLGPDIEPDTEPDIEPEVQSEWAGVEIASANAPDELSLVVQLTAEPQEKMELGDFSAVVNSDYGSINVTGATWNAEELKLTLSTTRQKLGVTYTVGLGSQGSNMGLVSAQFIAADTRKLWVTDFDHPSMKEMLVNSYRVFAGEHCVAYVVEGQEFPGAAEAAQEFDDLIYPVLTQALYEPMDVDGNERIVILFTDSDDYGGYFSPVNQWTAFFAGMYGAKSNEMEILYISGWSGADYFAEVEAHEFQHLLYFSRHQLKDGIYWEYHDEGLAESAVGIVYGTNWMSAYYYQIDYSELISRGLSLVNWEYGLYENYALAYVFWAWVAGQLGGHAAYKLIFEIEHGSPEAVSAFLQENLGLSLHEAVAAMMAAVRIQAAEGLYSFNGMLQFDPSGPPMAPAGVSELSFQPFGGVFFPTTLEQVALPEGPGPNMQFQGITALGQTDSSANFDTTGGWLIAYNANPNYHSWNHETTGSLDLGPPPAPRALLPSAPGAKAPPPPISPNWRSPSPRNPFSE